VSEFLFEMCVTYLDLSFVGSWFQGETVIAKIENVIGVIEGEEEPDRYIFNSEWQ